MRPEEKKLLEAIGNLFQNKSSRLGIAKDGPDEYSHTLQFQREVIEDMFALKTADSAFHEDLCGAFRDIHSYKYLDDPTFAVALNKRLTARGIPTKEINKVLEHVESIKKELGKDFQEKEAGWHPEIAEIADMTRNAHDRKPKHLTPYSGSGGPAPDKNEIK